MTQQLRECRFSVFGRPMAVVDSGRGWELFLLGPEGKRRRADVPVPSTMAEAEIETWLADVFHEIATPRHPDVIRLPRHSPQQRGSMSPQ